VIICNIDPRWATHGVPSTVNSHPHTSGKDNEFVVVHNGIITNYKDVKLFLQVPIFDLLLVQGRTLS
jgi:glucosamine--fructose-6-phosphate aminotransferase (isomerizing)